MPKQSTEPILIGCELLVRKDGRLLLGLRGKACFGAGTWALPGGHLEFGERLVEAGCREVKEELGAEVSPHDLQLVSIVDDYQEKTKKHYVHVSFEILEPSWQPRIMEPDECDEWRYFDLDDLPANFFPPHTGIIKNYLQKTLYPK
jgi:8-oxo-dGTP diphosphatase